MELLLFVLFMLFSMFSALMERRKRRKQVEEAQEQQEAPEQRQGALSEGRVDTVCGTAGLAGLSTGEARACGNRLR